MLTVKATVTGDTLSDVEAGLEEVRKAVVDGFLGGQNEGESGRSYVFDVDGKCTLVTHEDDPEIRRLIEIAFVEYGPAMDVLFEEFTA